MSDKKFDGIMLPPGSPKVSGGFPLSRTVMTRTTELDSYFYKCSKDSKGSNTLINNVNNNIKNQNRNKNTTTNKEDKEQPSFNGSFIITGAVSCASLKQEDTWAYDCVQSLDFFNALNNNDKDNPKDNPKDNDKDTTTKDNPNPTTTKETTSPQNIKSTKSSKHSLTSIKLIAGVFDGHDGPQMSDYCREHMIPHIIEELKKKEKVKKQQQTTSHHTHHTLHTCPLTLMCPPLPPTPCNRTNRLRILRAPSSNTR